MLKPEAVSLRCKCGEKVDVWTFFSNAPAGWDQEHWRNHGQRKAVACDRGWKRQVEREAKRLHRAFCRRAAVAGRTLDEQAAFEEQEARQFWQKLLQGRKEFSR